MKDETRRIGQVCAHTHKLTQTHTRSSKAICSMRRKEQFVHKPDGPSFTTVPPSLQPPTKPTNPSPCTNRALRVQYTSPHPSLHSTSACPLVFYSSNSPPAFPVYTLRYRGCPPLPYVEPRRPLSAVSGYICSFKLTPSSSRSGCSSFRYSSYWPLFSTFAAIPVHFHTSYG